MSAPQPKTKVAVRDLPPTLTAEAFRALLDESFRDAYDYLFFIPGSVTLRKSKKSKALVNFKDPKTVFAFAEKFNGHAFIDNKGKEDRARVEFAPSQKVCPPRKKDKREGTLESDPDFLKFVEDLSKPPEPPASVEALLDAKLRAEDKPIISPLLQSLIARRNAKLIAKVTSKEEKRKLREAKRERIRQKVLERKLRISYKRAQKEKAKADKLAAAGMAPPSASPAQPPKVIRVLRRETEVGLAVIDVLGAGHLHGRSCSPEEAAGG
eukprot:m51a1_g9258 hypothetical protein (267) ;mRNA; f:55245-56612